MVFARCQGMEARLRMFKRIATRACAYRISMPTSTLWVYQAIKPGIQPHSQKHTPFRKGDNTFHHISTCQQRKHHEVC